MKHGFYRSFICSPILQLLNFIYFEIWRHKLDMVFKFMHIFGLIWPNWLKLCIDLVNQTKHYCRYDIVAMTTNQTYQSKYMHDFQCCFNTMSNLWRHNFIKRNNSRTGRQMKELCKPVFIILTVLINTIITSSSSTNIYPQFPARPPRYERFLIEGGHSICSFNVFRKLL